MDQLSLRCSRCGASADPLAWRCPACGGALDLDYGEAVPQLRLGERGEASGAPEGMWRYLRWLPIAEPLSLGEPRTPLVSIGWDGLAVTLKLEGALPTGSFKDRGSAAMVSWLVSHGASHAVVDSSGNAGASLAAYSARAGLTCHVFSPSTAAKAKLCQIVGYGAILHEVDGNREQVEEAAIEWAADGVYASHCWNPLFVAGMQSFAFELWDQLGGNVPDAVVLPAGAGTLLLGAARGFEALRFAGLTSSVPRIFGVQSSSCSPLATAWDRQETEPSDVELRPTIAEGICVRRPPRGHQILAAVRSSGGAIVAVDDDALRMAHKQLAHHGVFAEYTSATAAAGLSRLLADGQLSTSDRVILAVSATGLKTAAMPTS